jgi:hypothetical protein
LKILPLRNKLSWHYTYLIIFYRLSCYGVAGSVDQCGPYLPLLLGAADSGTTLYSTLDVYADTLITMGGYTYSPSLFTAPTISVNFVTIVSLVNANTLSYIWSQQYYGSGLPGGTNSD